MFIGIVVLVIAGIVLFCLINAEDSARIAAREKRERLEAAVASLQECRNVAGVERWAGVSVGTRARGVDLVFRYHFARAALEGQPGEDAVFNAMCREAEEVHQAHCREEAESVRAKVCLFAVQDFQSRVLRAYSWTDVAALPLAEASKHFQARQFSESELKSAEAFAKLYAFQRSQSPKPRL